MALESSGGVFVLIFLLFMRRRPRRIFWGSVLKIPPRQLGSARLFGPIIIYPPGTGLLGFVPCKTYMIERFIKRDLRTKEPSSVVFLLSPILIFAVVFSLFVT